MAISEYPKEFVAAVEREYAEEIHVLEALRGLDHEHLGSYLMHGHQSVALKLEDMALIVFRGPRGVLDLINRLRRWGLRLDLHAQWVRLHNL